MWHMPIAGEDTGLRGRRHQQGREMHAAKGLLWRLGHMSWIMGRIQERNTRQTW